MSSERGRNGETTHELIDGGGFSESEVRFRSFFDNYADAMFIGKPDGTILAANPAAQKMFGMTEAELRAAGRSGITVNDERMDRAIRERSEKGTTTSELIFRRKDGSTFPGEATSTLFKDAKGSTGATIAIRDITERKRWEESVARTKGEMSTILEHIDQGFFSLNKDWQFKYVNRVAAENVGRKPEDLVGKDLRREFPLYTTTKAAALYQKVMEERVVATIEERGIMTGRDYEQIIYPIPEGIAVFWNDVTDRKKVEEALLNAKLEWEQTFDHIPDLIAILDADQNIVRANKAMLEHMGSPDPEQYVGQKCFHCVHGTNCPPEFCPHVLTLADGKEHVAEVHEERLGGDFLVSTTPIIDKLGRIKGTVHVARNITELKKTEDALRESETKYKGLFENIKEGVSLRRLVYNSWGEVIDAVLVEANPAALEVYGASSIEELRGKSYYDTASPNMAVAALDIVREMKASGEPVTAEEHSDINNRDYQITTTPLGKDLVITTSVDITERKRSEELIKRSNEELRQFAYVASHDLQEPLRMVTSYLGLLEKKFGNELSPQAKEFMGFAVDGSLRMKLLIDDLLEYSRIDSRPVNLEDVDMNIEAETVLHDLRSAIEEKEAEVIVNPLPTIRADDTQMKQLLTNLISNAIKFHGHKPSRVEVSAITYGNEFVFCVKDNGIGIDPRYADRLFKMFSRLHTKEEYPGTGIGLAICKKIVERHGGRIWFESESGKGTTFYFAIPA
ncbi:MAG: PAS domain S-box protein [Methanomassiliicoccus sp.]|nr:PAS domain S-box protein [Methanomassiliicoccus sp.]